MFFFFFNEHLEDLRNAAESSNIKAIIECEDYYFQKALDKYEEYKNLNVDDSVLNDLINQSEAKPFSYEKLLNNYSQGTKEQETLRIIGELISYIDKNAAMKNTLNEYSDKRTMALAFVRQNVWVKYLLRFKQGASLEELPEVIQNALRYIEHPDKEISVFAEQRKTQIFKTIFDGKDGNLFECMKEIGIRAKNPKNDGYLYSKILHSENIRQLWEEGDPPILVRQKKTWSYAPGEDGRKWDELRENGIMAIGWDEIGDLKEYKSKEEIKNELRQVYGTESNYMNDGLALWQFCNEIQIGDRIFAKAGSKTLLGIGEVVSDYEYDNDREEYKHIRKIKWIKAGRWELDEKFAIKTLTDITAFDEFCKKVEAIVADSGNDRISSASFLKWFSPIIEALKELGGEGTPVQVREKIIVNCNLTESELTETRGKNNTNKFKNEVAFAREYLKKDGYLNASTSGVWKLTDKGYSCVMTDELASSIFKRIAALHKALRDGVGVLPDETWEVYTKQDFLKDVFISEEQYESLKELLRRKKNIILQGAPGVGKTYAAKRLAYSIMGEKDEDRVKLIQFHQSYSYEDFIMGYRPTDNGFSIKHGVFYDFCKLAQGNPDKPFFFIIDEINRGNLSRIFGELLMLIEADKRGEKMTLAYEDVNFYVPENVYIIGMMNTADRSLAIIDYALRRRFCFFELVPAFKTENFSQYLKDNNVDDAVIEKIVRKLSYLNSKIENDPNLGSGFRIGHSYFCDCNTDSLWYENVIKYEVAPLLEEYWFDDLETAKDLIKELLR